MTGNNPNLQVDLVTIKAYTTFTKFGQILSIFSTDIERYYKYKYEISEILSICSQNIERKRNSGINQGK